MYEDTALVFHSKNMSQGSSSYIEAFNSKDMASRQLTSLHQD